MSTGTFLSRDRRAGKSLAALGTFALSGSCFGERRQHRHELVGGILTSVFVRCWSSETSTKKPMGGSPFLTLVLAT
jgi:hypothetical protein